MMTYLSASLVGEEEGEEEGEEDRMDIKSAD